MECLYILSEIRCPCSFITGRIRKRNRSSLQHSIHSFSCISEVFCTSFPRLFCCFVSHLYCPLVHIWKTSKSPFFHIRQFNHDLSHQINVYSGQNLLQDFLQGPISGRHSLYSSTSSIQLVYLLLTTAVCPARSFTANL